MKNKSSSKQLSNSFSTGGGGVIFEHRVQASFVVLMLTGGYAPCLPCHPITKIKLQGRVDGFETDDMIIFVKDPNTYEEYKLLGQIKTTIQITKSKSAFSEFIQAAWNDFNNPDIFNKEKDIITLITSNLTAADYRPMKWVLEQVQYSSKDEFFKKVSKANFSPQKTEEKLEVIKENLKRANHNKDITEDQFYQFLTRFRLLQYDLDIKSGIVESLLCSHISQFNHLKPDQVWAQISAITANYNKNAGVITKTELYEKYKDLKERFTRPSPTHIPKKFTNPPAIKSNTTRTDWKKHSDATILALVNLVGEWDENNPEDIEIINGFICQKDPTWKLKLNEILQIPDSPFSLKNGQWKIKDRSSLCDSLGSRIFNEDLDNFKDIAISVLTERDPSLELPAEKRFMAGLYNKNPTYSSSIKNGLSEGLAMLGNKRNALDNCSHSKVESITILTIRTIFNDADWKLWASLRRLLPTLAESAPDEFLNVVDTTLQSTSNPFRELFLQEGKGINLFDDNYLAGLLWALEVLAWDKNFLVRVCVLFGELASIDPDGSWADRPLNSLVTILLPWFPQTVANIEKRKVAVKTLCDENPEIAWKLIIQLLPNRQHLSSGTSKPSWRNTIPKTWKEKEVTKSEYWKQVSFYINLAITIAKKDIGSDIEKLVTLIKNFSNLTEDTFGELLKVLSLDTVFNIPEKHRLTLWEHLKDFTNNHRRYSDAQWSLNEKYLLRIDDIIKKLTPSNPLNLYRYLFSRDKFDLYEKNGNWDEQRKELASRRQEAIKQILKFGGIKKVIEFNKQVKFPQEVGNSLGNIANDEIDLFLLPKHLKDIYPYSFIGMYIQSRHYIKKWSWVDELNKSIWSKEQIAQFLSFLPFTIETWNRATQWLNNEEDKYWKKVDVYPYRADSNLDFAVKKLLKYKRPLSAIECLYSLLYNKKTVNIKHSIRALLDANSANEPYNREYHNNAAELIEFLQNNPDTSPNDLYSIEWLYLPLFEYNKVSPKFLEKNLAKDPEFFCQIIQWVYRSKSKSDAKKISKSQKIRAERGNQLLRQWKIPPGTQEDDSFDSKHFSDWLKKAKEICRKSGHLEVALSTIGSVLIHCPKSEKGFQISHNIFINNDIAKALNQKDLEKMRRGFEIAISNSRGIHIVDFKEEKNLAQHYTKIAGKIENAGHHRLADNIWNLSKRHTREANRIKNEYGI